MASMPQTAPPSLAKPVEKELAPRAAAPASVASLASSAAPPSADAKALSDLADTRGWNMSFEQASASKPGAVAPDLTGRSNLDLKRPEKQKQSPLLQNFNMNYRDGTVLFQESDELKAKEEEQVREQVASSNGHRYHGPLFFYYGGGYSSARNSPALGSSVASKGFGGIGRASAGG